MLLAGDIGGTKTAIGLFSRAEGPRRPLVEKRYESDRYGSLYEIVASFISDVKVVPECASFGVAGPVRDGRSVVTNLPWQIDSVKLSQSLSGIPVFLLNDLAAVASAISYLEEADLVQIKSGNSVAEEPIAVVAPGTGLGEAYLFWDGKRYRPIASEGGHTDFAPATPRELALLAYLQPKFGHVSYERVCSGSGIPNLYAFLRDTGVEEEPEWLRERMRSTEDPTPIIIQSAKEKSAAICEATVHLFLSILGSEAGNLVLQALARGGVYLGGGIPPRLLDELSSDVFLQAFTDKGRFRDLMEQVPIYVIMNSKAGLYGAAVHGFMKIGVTSV